MRAGVLISAPIVTAILVYLGNHPWSLYPSTAALPGIVSGFIWNGGNALSIVATRSPAVGLAIAYPSKLITIIRFVELSWRLLLPHKEVCMLAIPLLSPRNYAKNNPFSVALTSGLQGSCIACLLQLS